MARTEASAASASFSSSSNTLSAEQESKRLFGQVSALSRGDSSGMKTCPTEPMGALMELKQTPDTALLERSLVRGYMYGAGCALKSTTTNVAPCACAMPWLRECRTSPIFGQADARVKRLGYCGIRLWVFAWPLLGLLVLAFAAQRYVFSALEQANKQGPVFLVEDSISDIDVNGSPSPFYFPFGDDQAPLSSAYGALLHATSTDGVYAYSSRHTSLEAAARPHEEESVTSASSPASGSPKAVVGAVGDGRGRGIEDHVHAPPASISTTSQAQPHREGFQRNTEPLPGEPSRTAPSVHRPRPMADLDHLASPVEDHANLGDGEFDDEYDEDESEGGAGGGGGGAKSARSKKARGGPVAPPGGGRDGSYFATGPGVQLYYSEEGEKWSDIEADSPFPIAHPAAFPGRKIDFEESF
eukprot:CAMPEP_0178992568 /NCGR_PEP_ID=MMETSP0795-20121207/6188_1 /TAXON_ID=88552 /ORGANISM="Amoebophrya sp., Strain Ameob2" /LENGTH=413 /DNA_ID=CAMNT_0020684467 /DNA_START=344 /DNA_END=1585 /DNA_ORIENTATION=+